MVLAHGQISVIQPLIVAIIFCILLSGWNNGYFPLEYEKQKVWTVAGIERFESVFFCVIREIER